MPGLREIFATFQAKFDSKELVQGEKKVQGLTNTLGKFGVYLGAGYLATRLKHFGETLTENLDHISLTSKRVGITSEQFQKYAHAAALANVSSDSLARALIFLQKKGGEPVATAFPKVIKAIEAADSPAKKIQLAFKNFGRAGTELIPLFEEGSEGIDRMGKDLEELGGIYSNKVVAQGERARDTIDRFKAGLQGLKVVSGELLLPALQKTADSLIEGIKWFRKATEGVNIARGAFSGLAVYGIYKITAGLQALTPEAIKLFAKNGLMVAGVAAAVLAIEDLATAYAGGRSVIREFLLDLTGFDINDFLDPIVEGIQRLPKLLGVAFDILKIQFQRFLLFTSGAPKEVRSALDREQLALENSINRRASAENAEFESKRLSKLTKRVLTQQASGTAVQRIGLTEQEAIASRVNNSPLEQRHVDRVLSALQINVQGVSKADAEFVGKTVAKHVSKQLRQSTAAIGAE